MDLYPLGDMEGLSGLSLESQNQDSYIFWSLTDRGPNVEKVNDKGIGRSTRVFPIPDFRPYWIRFSVSKKSREVKILNKIELKLTGLPNNFDDELPLDETGQQLKKDPMGVDPESICADEKYIWVGEEYGPSILKFTKDGRFLKRYGQEFLPKKIQQRRMNRGFEGIACVNNRVYAILQSPLPADGKNILLIEFNPYTEKTERQFNYPLESLSADKIGDMSVKDDYFYVIEQNSGTGEKSFHRVYKFKLDKIDVHGALVKELVIDLVKAGYDFAEKIEGLSILDNNQLVIVNDNDFGYVGFDKYTGKILKDSSKKTVLGIVNY